jgi:copper ion binding protein
MSVNCQETIELKVEGMSCGHCKASVEKAVSAVEGVLKVEVDLAGKKATINCNSEKVTEGMLRKTIADLGYGVE